MGPAPSGDIDRVHWSVSDTSKDCPVGRASICDPAWPKTISHGEEYSPPNTLKNAHGTSVYKATQGCDRHLGIVEGTGGRGE